MKDYLNQVYGDLFATAAPEILLHELCITCGHRFAGSDSALRAATFMLNHLKACGYDNVVLEPFPITTWERGELTLKLESPVSHPFPAITLPYSPSCNLTAPLLDLGTCTEDQVFAADAAIKGKIILVDDRNPPQGPHLHRMQKYLMVKEAGAVGFIFAHTNPGMLAPTGSLAFNQTGDLYQAIPGVGISYETAWELRRRVCDHEAMVSLTLTNNLQRGSCNNVIATLKGQTDNLIIVGAHYDGHDIAQAAVDNASGTIAVLEAARVIRRLNVAPYCTIKFILFSGEELGLVGSNAYTVTHASELPRIRMVFNLDCFSGTGQLSLILHGPAQLTELFNEQVKLIPDAISLTNQILPFSDHFPFFLKSVPGAFCYIPTGNDRGWGHTIADTSDKVNVHSIRRGTSALIPLILHAATLPSWPIEPIDHAATKKLLLDKKMEPLMRYEGHWLFED